VPYGNLLNQALIWIVRGWFLEIAFVHDVDMHAYVYVPVPKGIHVNEPYIYNQSKKLRMIVYSKLMYSKLVGMA